MNKLKRALISFILPLAAVFLVASCYTKKQPASYLCRHQYALCTSALCIPLPDNPAKAICFCDVHEGDNMATVPCESVKPSIDANGIKTLYSTFSLHQFINEKQVMTCPAGTPWSWCLNKRCTVDPSNPKTAICVCDILRTEEWITLGGKCDTSTCKTGYWSGASINDFNDGVIFLSKALGLTQSPVKWCQKNP